LGPSVFNPSTNFSCCNLSMMDGRQTLSDRALAPLKIPVKQIRSPISQL
jgi:hypothetical protein